MDDERNGLLVRCVGCEQTLLRVERIGDPEIALLREHLRACGESDPLAQGAPLGDVMRRIRVTSVRE